MTSKPHRSAKLKVLDTEDRATLLEQTQSSLRGYIISLMAGSSETEDVLQETNTYLLKNLDKYELGTNFKAWAFSVARYRVLEHRRYSGRSKVSYLSDDIINLIADSAVDRLPQEDDRILHLRDCLAKLEQGERNLLRIAYLERTPLTQLAKSLGKTASSLHKAISRIRLALRGCIEKKLR